MPRRTTTAELRDRLDGLGIAFFAITGAMLEALAEAHPAGETLAARLTVRAMGLLLELHEVEQDSFSDEALDHAYAALLAAFSGTQQSGAGAGNDNEDG